MILFPIQLAAPLAEPLSCTTGGDRLHKFQPGTASREAVTPGHSKMVTDLSRVQPCQSPCYGANTQPCSSCFSVPSFDSCLKMTSWPTRDWTKGGHLTLMGPEWDHKIGRGVGWGERIKMGLSRFQSEVSFPRARKIAVIARVQEHQGMYRPASCPPLLTRTSFLNADAAQTSSNSVAYLCKKHWQWRRGERPLKNQSDDCTELYIQWLLDKLPTLQPWFYLKP